MDKGQIQEAWTENSEGLVVQRSQTGLADHIDYCQARQNEGFHGPNKDFKLRASIPSILIEHYIQQKGITLNEFLTSQEHVRAMVNDPDLAYFRIAPGRM
jgi:hypothetical protein